MLAAREAGNDSVTLRVDVEGSPRALHAIMRDEIYRIACEALRNAYRHAQARQIEVELEYHDRELRLRVRDDGKGMDVRMLEGRSHEGHFGLHGMRERAKLIGAKLEVWSAPAKGTEVELSVPASRVYAPT
jgi:signal transduction histidine kinase